jgi:nucleoid-associated protein YgaU
MTDKGDRPSGTEEPPADQRSDAGAPSPQEADALLLENLSPFLDPHGPPPHDPPSASDTASWRYDDHGMPLRPRRRNRIVRVLAPVAFLILVVALVTVVLQSGILNGGSSGTPSASPSSSTTAAFTLYKVKKGDTLSGIAHKKHTNTTAILDLNPGLNENSLSVGQKIKVPQASPSP